MITRPRKCVRAASSHIWSVTAGSSVGTKCESTSVFTPAACATRPQSSAEVWLARMLLQRGSVRVATHQPVHRRKVERFVHEDVRTAGERHEGIRARGVAGDHDRPVVLVEAEGERRDDRRMADEGGRHPAGSRPASRGPPHAARACGPAARAAPGPRPTMRVSMSYAFISKNSRIILVKRRASPHVHPALEAGSPREQQQVADVRVVVRVMVSDEDMPDRRERHPGQCQLTGDAVPTVDDIGGAVGDNDLGGRRGWLLGPRPAGGAEQDEPRPCARHLRMGWPDCRRSDANGCCEERPATASQHALSLPHVCCGLHGASRR